MKGETDSPPTLVMKRNAGFTIIEMLIVVTVIAMLAGILIPVLADGTSTARDARRAHDLRAIQAALADYFQDHGAYPDTNGNWQGDSTADGGLTYDANGYIPGLVPDYLQSLPRDPDPQYPNATFGYAYRSDGVDFKCIARGTPESYGPTNPFRDPQAPNDNWQVSSPGGYYW
jgi:prepilin-type N-terminal cleavage/methylation domain-containing protein